MHPRAAMFLQERANARARGDRGVERCMDVELSRMGYRETTQQVDELETAVPEKPRRGRPPKPRCEHGKVPDRCLDCTEGA